MSTKKWVGTTTNWSTSSNWEPVAQPTTGTEVEFVSAHNNPVLFRNPTANCKSLEVLTGYTASMTQEAGGCELNIGGSTAAALGFALKLTNEISTWESPGHVTFQCTKTGTITEQITTAGNKLGEVVFGGVIGVTYKFNDNLTSTNVTVNSGTVETANHNIEAAYIKIASAGEKSIKLGSSTLKVTNENTTAWKVEETTGLTFEGSSSTIELSGEKGEFKGGGLTYGTLVSGNKGQKVLGSNTFTKLTINNKGAAAEKGLKLEAGATQTISEITTNGVGGEKCRLESTSAGTRAKIKKTSGTVTIKNTIIKDIEAEGGAKFVAGEGSENGGNNVGIEFSGEPSPVELKATLISASKLTGGISGPVHLTNSLVATGELSAELLFGVPEAKYGPESWQFLEIYKALEANAPTVLCVHPGGWVQPEIGAFRAPCVALQGGEPGKGVRGMLAFNMEYHLATSTSASFARSIEDVVLAAEWCIAHAGEYNGNPKKFFLIGASAGGHLAQAAAKILGDKIKGVITLSGIPDLRLSAEEIENKTLYEIANNGDYINHFQKAVQQNIPGESVIEGAEETTTTKSREYQEKYSPSRSFKGGILEKTSGSAKWLIFNSEFELVSSAQTEALVNRLKEEGKWNKRSRRVLRTASTNALKEEGTFEERKTNNGTGKGHAMAYWTEVKSGSNGIVAFILNEEPELTSVTGIIRPDPTYLTPKRKRFTLARNTSFQVPFNSKLVSQSGLFGGLETTLAKFKATIKSTSALEGSLKTRGQQFQSSIKATSALTGSLKTTSVKLNTNLSSSSALTGKLTTTSPKLASSIQSNSALEGQLKTSSVKFTTNLASNSTLTGSIRITNSELKSNMAANGGLFGSLITQTILATQLSSAGFLTGELKVNKQIKFETNIFSSATLSGKLTLGTMEPKLSIHIPLQEETVHTVVSEANT